jgi:thiol:disulfide interchange protein
MLLLIAAIAGVNGCKPEAATSTSGGSPIVLDASMVTRRGSIEFVRGFELGRQVARDRDRPCLVFFTAHWCTYCSRMEATTFNDAAVAQLATRFVCVLVDADREPEVCRRLEISGYPTVELISPAGASLGRLTGWQSAPAMVHSLQAALHRYAWLEPDGLTTR